MSRVTIAIAVAAALFGGDALAGDRAAPDGTSVDFFETRVRPVLSDHCYACHSVRAKKLKGGLRLDARDLVLKGGEYGPAIVPGDPEHSRLIGAIRYLNPDLRMPPKARLQTQQVDDLVEWVKRGAPWPDDRPPAGGAAPSVAAATPEGFDLSKRRASHWAWQ